MRFQLLSFFIVIALAAPALAYDTPGIEAFFGASNIVATTGNGRLTAAISPEGDLSVLAWPSPSYYDHLQYVASNEPGVRDVHRAGALDGMGVFAGLLVEDGAGERTVSWFNDPEKWSVRVTYGGVDSIVVETTFTNDDAGIEVVQRDFVDVDADVLYRDYEVTLEATADVANLSILGYSNLSPSQTKLAEMPIADFAFEQHQDFAAVWDQESGAVLHFHPADNGTMSSPLGIARIVDNMRKEFGALGALLEAETIDDAAIDSLVTTIDDEFAEGVYIAHGSAPVPDQFQIGYDRTPICDQIDILADNITEQLDAGENPGFTIPSNVVNILRCGQFDPLGTPRSENAWQHDATDALEDARDGELSGNRVAAAQVNSALRVPVALTGTTGRATLYYAFGSSRAEANATLADAISGDVDATRDEVAADSAAWAADLVMPEGIGEAYRTFLIRAFLNLRVGTDADSGAIVASISRQPSYHVDWPRDGVFFDVALDLAGKHELVRKRLAFYSETMRSEPDSPTPIINTGPPGWPDDEFRDDFPAGSWEMNYYADGVRSGNIRLEIDNTALVVWSFADHAGWIDDDTERRAFLEESWPTVQQSAEWLAGWRDPETGLIWPANEDDHIEYTQGIQGSGTTFLALEAAAMIATELGHTDEADRWTERARELHAAMLTHLWDEEAKRFQSQPEGSVREVSNPTAWIGWPIRILPWDDENLRDQIREGLDRHVSTIRGERSRGQYSTKVATSAALMFVGEPEVELADEIARTLATEIATPDTQMLGESYVNDDTDGDGVFDRRLNLQGNPHLWSAILVYITARAVSDPEAFDRYRDVLPAVDVRTTFQTMEPPPGDAPPATPDVGETSIEPDMGSPDAGPGLADRPVSGSSCACATRGAGGDGSWLLLVLAAFVTRVKREASTR